jgi:hypothetical protein
MTAPADGHVGWEVGCTNRIDRRKGLRHGVCAEVESISFRYASVNQSTSTRLSAKRAGIIT